MAQTHDIDSHMILCRSLDGSLYFAETEPGLTLKQAAELIRKGEHDRIVSVFAFNPAEGWSQDRTSDVALEVAALARDEGFLSPQGIEFIDSIDEEVGNTIRWAA